MTDLTLSAKTLAAARTSIVRLNCQLAELRQEQRCQVRRSRLEAEHARIQAFINMLELIERCNGMDIKPLVQIVPLDPKVPDGVKLVLPAAEVAAAKVAVEVQQKRKPDGLPTLAKMITTAFEDAAQHGRDSLAPREVTEFIRRKWWSDAPNPTVNSSVWRLAKAGKLGRAGERYTLIKPKSDLQRQFAGYAWEA